MKYAVDTNVLRELRHPRGNVTVKACVAAIAEADLFLSVIVIGEMWKGIAKLPPGDGRSEMVEWAEDVERLFGKRVLPIDAEIARRWGEITMRLQLRGRVLHAPDGLIAATCLAHDLTLLTRNVADFADTGVRTLDPWTTAIC